MRVSANGRPAVARAVAGVRVAVGAAMVARPTWLLRPLGVDTVTANRLAWLARLTGGRDLVLGAGALGASADARRLWTLAAAAADSLDAVTLAAAVRRRQIPAVSGGLAALSAAVAVIAVLGRPARRADAPRAG